ncbi:MAG: DUF4325 domain-containing protein [Bryobacteraceae bacterium]
MARSSTGKLDDLSDALTLDIAADFTRTPGGRYREEGPFSGEEFRETVLTPRFEQAIKQGRNLIVILDGGYGYASSFLEEAFGGLARNKGKSTVARVLYFDSKEEPYLVDDVRRYIEESRA